MDLEVINLSEYADTTGLNAQADFGNEVFFL